MGDRINNFKTLMKNPQQRNIYLVLAVAGVASVAIGAWFSLRSTPASQVNTGVNLAGAPKLSTIPGSSDSTRYNERVGELNDKETQKALEKGTTFVPTIVNNQLNALSPFDALAVEEQKKREKMEMDEKDRLLKEEMERKALEALNTPPPAPALPPPPPVQVIAPPVAPAPVVPPEPEPKWKANDYVLITAVQEAWKNKAPSSEFDHFGKNPDQRTQAQLANAGTSQYGAQMQTSAQTVAVDVPDQKAGDILHAVLDTGVNSSEPSPIMATIVSGQYKGAKILGRFAKSGKKVVLQFSTMSIPGYPTSVKINSIAIDPETKRTSMATDVDNHYFLKYGVLLAATFLKGYSNAIANQGTTTTVTPLGGIIQTQNELSSKDINRKAMGEVGQELASQTKQSIAGLEPTVYVEAGTPMGVLFMEDFYLNSGKK